MTKPNEAAPDVRASRLERIVMRKKCERLKPSTRVYYALKRVSRDKYISAEQVMQIAHVFIGCACRSQYGLGSIYKHATEPAWEIFGMYKGRGLFEVNEYCGSICTLEEYRLKKKKKKQNDELLFILEQHLKGAKWKTT